MGFEKGNRANPGGRPRKSDEQRRFEQRCREWADTLGFDKLKRWADSEDAGKSIEALKEIFNRGFGKPVETQVIDAEITGPSGSSVEDLAKAASELIGDGAGQGGGVDSPPALDSGK